VPNPYPRPLPPELESEIVSNRDLRSIKETYDEFIGVVRRSTVKVVPPTERLLLDRIHKTIEYVVREGPVFEAIIIARENKNPAYTFLYDNQSQEHIYYRWKLYSILHGDDPYEWRTDEFRMFEGGSIWKPPPLNPYANGMPDELLERTITGESKLAVPNSKRRQSSFIEKSRNPFIDDSRVKGSLGTAKRDMLGNLLRDLDPTRKKVGHLMMFCISHADAAEEIIDCIHESLKLLETPFQKKIARIFLVSDILHNCSAAVTNASFYRKGFQTRLISIFEYLREYLINIEDGYKADKFKQRVLSVLGAWKEWTLYEDEFVIKLSNVLLGIKPEEPHTEHELKISPKNSECDLDGVSVDDETLGKCLEAKGLSLRWYNALELSDDEVQSDSADQLGGVRPSDRSPASARGSSKGEASLDKIRFKASKWETVDPYEVAGQVVTISKWESIAKYGEDSARSSENESTSCDESSTSELRGKEKSKADSEELVQEM